MSSGGNNFNNFFKFLYLYLAKKLRLEGWVCCPHIYAAGLMCIDGGGRRDTGAI